jgi:hypothetical protein
MHLEARVACVVPHSTCGTEKILIAVGRKVESLPATAMHEETGISYRTSSRLLMCDEGHNRR